MKKLVGLLSTAAFFLVACRNASAPPVRQFTDQQLAAEFPADLGPDRIDVSAYPPGQQANYQLFAGKCSQCHTLARPINSPLRTEEDWARYVTRMYGKMEVRYKEKLLTENEAKQVISFLGFDSRERKQKHPQEFLKQQEQLAEMFRAVQAERARVQDQRGREKARESSPYVGDKPS